MKENTDKLKVALLQMGFSQQCYEQLDTYIQHALDPLPAIPKYQFREKSVEFSFVIGRDDQADLSLKGVDVQLYKTLDTTSFGFTNINIPSLSFRMASVDWKTPVLEWDRSMVEKWDKIKTDLYRLKQTENGRKVAGMLVARHGCHTDDFDRLKTGIYFDPRRAQYFSRYWSLTQGLRPFPEIVDHLRDRMHEVMPHLYLVKLLVADLASGKSAVLFSKQQFDSIKAADLLLGKVHQGFFDDTGMRQLALPWKVLHADIVDRVDNHTVVSKRVGMEDDAGLSEKSSRILCHVNADKIKPDLYLPDAIPRSGPAATNIKSAQQLLSQFDFVAPTGKRLLDKTTQRIQGKRPGQKGQRKP